MQLSEAKRLLADVAQLECVLGHAADGIVATAAKLERAEEHVESARLECAEAAEIRDRAQADLDAARELAAEIPADLAAATGMGPDVYAQAEVAAVEGGVS